LKVKIFKTLGCGTVVPMHGSEEEAPGFRDRLRKESPNAQVIVPKPLKAYKA